MPKEMFSVAVDCFSKFSSRRDYVRAAYWMAVLKYEFNKDVPIDIEQAILGATYREPDGKALDVMCQKFVADLFKQGI